MAKTIVTINNKRMYLIDAVNDSSINIHNHVQSTIQHRLKAGMSPEDAFKTKKLNYATSKTSRQEKIRKQVNCETPIPTDLENIPPETVHAMKNCTINEFLRIAEKYGTRIND